MAVSNIPTHQIKPYVDVKSLGNFSTVEELNALLDAELATMANQTWRSIWVTAKATFDVFVNTYVYTGTLYRNGSTSWSHVMLYANASADVISGQIGNVTQGSTWTYKRLATKDLATTSSAGLMSAADKAKLDTPETIIFPADRSLLNNAGYHNAIWRGKSLGGSLTSAQSAAITGGTFADLFLGDYWTINGVRWRIMGFDVFWECGDNSLRSHHVVVVPDTNLYKCKWNETANTTDGGPNGGIGYAGSFVRAIFGYCLPRRLFLRRFGNAFSISLCFSK